MKKCRWKISPNKYNNIGDTRYTYSHRKKLVHHPYFYDWPTLYLRDVTIWCDFTSLPPEYPILIKRKKKLSSEKFTAEFKYRMALTLPYPTLPYLAWAFFSNLYMVCVCVWGGGGGEASSPPPPPLHKFRTVNPFSQKLCTVILWHVTFQLMRKWLQWEPNILLTSAFFQSTISILLKNYLFSGYFYAEGKFIWKV